MSPTLDDLCQLMHNNYEIAAAKHGWYTNERSRVPWQDVPDENKAAMRDAVSALADAVRKDEQTKYGPEVIQSDLRQVMTTLGIGLRARDSSPHELVQNEILPEIRKLRKTMSDIGEGLQNILAGKF